MNKKSVSTFNVQNAKEYHKKKTKRIFLNCKVRARKLKWF